MPRLSVSLAAAAISLGLTYATGAVLAAPASHDPRGLEIECRDVECVAFAVADAVLGLDRSTLTSLHRERARHRHA
jgi:hypothetical protein